MVGVCFAGRYHGGLWAANQEIGVPKGVRGAGFAGG